MGGLLTQRLDLAQARRQGNLLLREFGAERVIRQQARLAVRPQHLLQAFGGVLSRRIGNAVALLDLAMGLGEFEQAVLEAPICHIDQPLDHLGVALSTQIGNAILGDNDVPEMARDRGMAVERHDIGFQRLATAASGSDTQYRAGAGQVMGHGHKIVLPADAADDRTVLQRVGRDRTAKSRNHAGVYKPGVLPLRAVEIVVLQQLVGAQHAGHADFFLISPKSYGDRSTSGTHTSPRRSFPAAAVGELRQRPPGDAMSY